MSKIIVVANTILGEELAVALYEIHEQAPDYSGFHRYQIIQVIRGDRIAEFRTDMGFASQWKGINQIRIPSILEYTVDELKDLADEFRGRPLIDVKELCELDNLKLG